MNVKLITKITRISAAAFGEIMAPRTCARARHCRIRRRGSPRSPSHPSTQWSVVEETELRASPDNLLTDGADNRKAGRREGRSGAGIGARAASDLWGTVVRNGGTAAPAWASVCESVIGRAGAPAPPFRTQPEAGSCVGGHASYRIRSGSSWLGPNWGAGRSRIDRLSRHRVARVANPDSGAPDPTPPQPQCLPHSDLPASPPSCYSGPFINRLSGLALGYSRCPNLPQRTPLSGARDHQMRVARPTTISTGIGP